MRDEVLYAFIENPKGSGSNFKYDEVSFELLGTKEINGKYPFAYGFIPNTLSEDGACLDCFVISDRELKSGFKFDTTVLDILEVWENGQVDHKLILQIRDECIQLNEKILLKIKTFEEQIFLKSNGYEMKVGKYKGRENALVHLDNCRENFFKHNSIQ